jgi:hypothetical protein
MNPPDATLTTKTVAWIGACTGVASLFWNIYVKLSAGPKLSVTGYAGMVMMPRPAGNPRFMRIIVRNMGTTPTTITTFALAKYDSLWSRLRKTEQNASFTAIIASYRGPQCPQTLEVGGELNCFMQQDARFEELLKSGDLWLAVYHSFSKKPVLSKIYVPSKH